MKIEEWKDIREYPIPADYPCEVKQEDGTVLFGCYHISSYAKGIISLTKIDKRYKWDGQSWLTMVTHWRHLVIPEEKNKGE